MAPRERFELSSAVLETVVLPLNYRDIGGSYGNRTRIFGSTVRYNSHYTNEPYWHSTRDSNSYQRFRRPLHCPVVLCEYIGSPGGNRTRKTGVLSAVHMPVLLRDYVGLLRGIRTGSFTGLSRLRVPFRHEDRF